MTNEEKILQILGEHTEALKELKQHRSLLDKIVIKVIEHDEQFKELREEIKHTVTKEEFTTKMDKLIGMYDRIDQERIVTNDTLKTDEEKIENLELRADQHELVLEEHDKNLQTINLQLKTA